MTPKRVEHMEDVAQRIVDEIREKYPLGQAEHGGNLWEQPGALTALRQELIDFIVYLDVVEQQLQAKHPKFHSWLMGGEAKAALPVD